MWGGVDWYGCDDDLIWERMDAPLPAPADLPGTPTRLQGLPADEQRPARRRRRSSGTTRTTSAGPTAPTGPIRRRVLILDVENVCPSSRRPVRALARLQAVLQAAGPVDQIIAASAASQHDRLDVLLQRAGVHVHTRCGNRPNAADRVLIEAARQFARQGDCEVVVASNDHGFRVIAGMPGVRRLVLITHPQLATARALLRVATELRVAAA